MPASATQSLSPLTETLRDRIRASGTISFRDFMAAALYDPGHGYYSSGRARIGRGGDFFTNVSVGRLFGAMLARQFAEMWDVLGRPGHFVLIEQGAHDGTLMDDVLGGLRTVSPDCLAVTRPKIIEPSPVWREKQQAKLAAWLVTWVDSVDALEPFTGVHYSNELIDAFPVHLVHRTDAGWSERFVDWDGDHFVFVDRPIADPKLNARLSAIEVPVGTVTEVNTEADRWISAVAGKLDRGFVLAIDYGFAREEYYRPDRTTGTLEAIAAHQREKDPLSRPGELDLTAHVDFTALAETALAQGLKVIGFTDQHHFLVGLAAKHFQEGVRPSPSDTRAFQTLAHPTMLGRSFKVFAASRGVDSEPTLAGFIHARDAEAELGIAAR
jgi:SAM-dependent MidA family methyltransferase